MNHGDMLVRKERLAPVCKAFGIDLPIHEKREILGLSKKRRKQKEIIQNY